MTKQYCVVVTAGLSDYKLQSKLVGLTYNNEVKSILVVRKFPLLTPMEKVVNIAPKYKILRWQVFFEVWRTLALFNVVIKNNADAIVGIQLIGHGVQAAICAKLTSRPAVLSVIGNDVHVHLAKLFYRKILRPFVRCMSMVTVMGDKSSKIIQEIGVPPRALVKIQNYQDISKYTDNKFESEWDIVFVGDLLSVKAVPDLIHALSLCNSDYRLAIVGDGPQKSKIEHLVRKLDVVRQVDFVGKVENVEDYLNRAKILVLPSKSEALPAVGVEAMYCGVPSILSDVGDISTYFKHQEGCLLYPSGNIEVLREYISRLLDDEEFYNMVSSYCQDWSKQHKNAWSIKMQCSIWSEILSKVTSE